MPDASQFTQIKRLQTSAAADQGAGPFKFRAPRFFHGWNPGQLIKFGDNALSSNKFRPIFDMQWLVSTFYNNPSYSGANSIGIDSEGNFYLGLNSRLLKLSPSGTLLLDVNISISALAIRGTFIYVSGGNAIRRYNLSNLIENNTGFTPITGAPVASVRTLAINTSGTHLFFVRPATAPFALHRIAINGSGTPLQLSGSEVVDAQNLTIRNIGGIDYAFISEIGSDVISRYNLDLPANIPRVIVAGTASNFGYSGDGGLATASRLRDPRGVAFDSDGNMYISDSGNNVIRRVDAVTNIITTFAGIQTITPTGSTGDGGQAINARFHNPGPSVFSPTGVLYISENSSTTRDFAAITNTTVRI